MPPDLPAPAQTCPAGRPLHSPQWTIAPVATASGVDLHIILPIDGRAVTAIVSLGRQEARLHARGVLAAAGDATERDFRSTAVLVEPQS